MTKIKVPVRLVPFILAKKSKSKQIIEDIPARQRVVSVNKKINKKGRRGIALLLAAASSLGGGLIINQIIKNRSHNNVEPYDKTIETMQNDSGIETETINNEVIPVMYTGNELDNEEVTSEEDNTTVIENEPEISVSYFASALKNSNIYEKASTKSTKYSILVKGEALPFKSDLGNGWYEVDYNDGSAYIKSDNLEIIECLEAPKQEVIPEIKSADELFLYVDGTPSVRATAKVNVRQGMSTKTKKLGQLSKGDTLKYIAEHDEWYEVEYKGKHAYVFKEYATVSYNYTPTEEMKDMVHATRKTQLLDIVTGDVIYNIPKNEVAEVYAKMGNYYLVNCEGHVGLMAKKHSISLGDTYIIIDISSQTMRVYVDDKLVLETPVVTGKDSTPTYCGVFEALEKGVKIYWKEFNVKVDQAIRFNRGIWIHDSKWRKKYGGTIYHKDGSHGCVNTPKKAMQKIFKIIKVGDLVLVKK